jgi:uncharacterized protein
MFSSGYVVDQRISSFMAGVYGWMSCALAVTASAAYYIAHTPVFFHYIQTHPLVLIGIFVGQLAFVFSLVFFLNRMNFITALVLFLLYSVSVGVTISSIFYVYTEVSIFSTFLTTALTFAVMSFYGYMTKSDLTTMGSMSFMVLIGIIVGTVINMFLQSAQFDYLLSGLGVIVFVLLTAYDTQKIKQLGSSMISHQEIMPKITLLGALTLYLDFINLFLFLLRFMGKQRDQ